MYHLGGDVDNRGDYASVDTRGLWEISVHSPQFCCESNCSKKNSLLKKKKGGGKTHKDFYLKA